MILCTHVNAMLGFFVYRCIFEVTKLLCYAKKTVISCSLYHFSIFISKQVTRKEMSAENPDAPPTKVAEAEESEEEPK